MLNRTNQTLANRNAALQSARTFADLVSRFNGDQPSSLRQTHPRKRAKTMRDEGIQTDTPAISLASEFRWSLLGSSHKPNWPLRLERWARVAVVAEAPASDRPVVSNDQSGLRGGSPGVFAPRPFSYSPIHLCAYTHRIGRLEGALESRHPAAMASQLATVPRSARAVSGG